MPSNYGGFFSRPHPPNKTPKKNDLRDVASGAGNVQTLIDRVGNIGPHSTGVVDSVAGAAHIPRADADRTSANIWFIGDPLLTFVSVALYGAYIAQAKGKQNRIGKLLYAFLGLTTLTLAATALGVLAALGFTFALIASPFVAIALATTSFARTVQKWWRAKNGIQPQDLLAQKEEKRALAEKANAQDRVKRFMIEAETLHYFLMRHQQEHHTKATREDPAFQQKLKSYLKISEEERKKQLSTLKNFVKSDFEEDYPRFYRWLAEQREINDAASRDPRFKQADKLVQGQALALTAKQQEKYAWRTRLLIILGILTIAAIMASLMAALPFFTPVALVATFKLIGAVAGATVIATSAAAGGIASYINYKQYKSFAAEHKNNPQLVADLKLGMSLQIAGTALFIVSSILFATAFLPFVNLAVLAIVGSAVLAAGIGVLIGGTAQTYKTRRRAATEQAQTAEETDFRPAPPDVQPASAPVAAPAPAPTTSFENRLDQTLKDIYHPPNSPGGGGGSPPPTPRGDNDGTDERSSSSLQSNRRQSH